MALIYLTHLTTFALIEDLYNKVKPLRGKKHGGKDVRPIGDRKRPHERIVKISDDCYAISDGWNYGDPIFGRSWPKDSKPSNDDLEFFAPIVWRRHEDGTETIKVRNADGPYSHQGRYAFINRCLPRGLAFSLGQHGRQYVYAYGTKYFLAKGTTVPKPVMAEALANRRAWEQKNPGQTYTSYGDWQTDVPDDASLTFTCNKGGAWHLVSHGGKKEEPPRPRVVIDHDAKDAVRTQIDAFRAWVHIIAPMIEVGGIGGVTEYADAIYEWQKANGEQYPRSWGEFTRRVTPELARAIVADAEHPLRVAMAAFAIKEAGLKEKCFGPEDVTAIKARFNRWINRALAFNKTV
jgi:hypothetical protein